MEQNENQVTLSIGDLWAIFTSRFIIIIAAAVFTLLTMLGIAVIKYESEYTSTAMIYLIRQENESAPGNLSSSDFSLALSTVNDCKYLLTSHRVLDSVIEVLGMPVTYSQLKSMITITNPTSSRILEISITAPTPMDAKIIVDELCVIGAESIMNALGMDQVNIIDQGTYSQNPSNSMVTPITPIVTLLVAMIVYGVFVLMHILDDKIKTPDDVEKYLELTVLGVVPTINGETDGKKYGMKYGKVRIKY